MAFDYPVVVVEVADFNSAAAKMSNTSSEDTAFETICRLDKCLLSLGQTMIRLVGVVRYVEKVALPAVWGSISK